jgi:hypothetical protein
MSNCHVAKTAERERERERERESTPFSNLGFPHQIDPPKMGFKLQTGGRGKSDWEPAL